MMKYIKLFENFNENLKIEDAKWIIISHLGEVKEVEINPKYNAKNLLMFELLEEPTDDQIKNCREHLFPEDEEKGFFLDDPYTDEDFKVYCLVGIGKTIKEYCINWLNDNFSNMEAVPSKNFPNTVLYRHDLKDNVLLYDKTNNKVYVNYRKIYAFFEYYFGLDEKEILDITLEWVKQNVRLPVSDTHKLNDVKATRFGTYQGRFEKCE
jgi:hypothetical protein